MERNRPDLDRLQILWQEAVNQATIPGFFGRIQIRVPIEDGRIQGTGVEVKVMRRWRATPPPSTNWPRP